mgnify:CR=1 FL=1
MNTQMKEYRKATLRLAYLLTLMLWTGSCIDMDINRNPYETTQDELMRENHIIGSSLKSMEALVVPTQEHLYQFVDIEIQTLSVSMKCTASDNAERTPRSLYIFHNQPSTYFFLITGSQQVHHPRTS